MKYSTYKKIDKIMPWVMGIGLCVGVGATIIDLIFIQCVYDGGEIGFDMQASLQNTNANDNFAPSGFALAA